MLGDLDFGPQLTPAARKLLTDIAQALHQIEVEDFEVVKSWFAFVAFVSKTYYHAWSAQQRGVLTRGLTGLWDDLQRSLGRLNQSLQAAQVTAIRSLVRPSPRST